MQKQGKGHSRCNDSPGVKVQYSDRSVYCHHSHGERFQNVDPILINVVKEIDKNWDFCV